MGNPRILIVHNRYLIRGGEEQSQAAEVRLLRDHGVIVDEFFRDNSQVEVIGKMRTALRTIWSRSTYTEIRKILRSQKYDFVLVQNFFPLISPSIYYAAASENIPVIQFLRNYRLLCLNAIFFREKHVCNLCLNKILCYPGIFYRCYRNSFLGSSVTALMIFAHRLIGTWGHKVDRYVALAEFSKRLFIKGGIPEEKIEIRPNFVHPDPGIGKGEGDFAVFVGRLSPEKGLNTLLDAWEKVGSKLTLKIIGEGDFSREVPGVEWLGKKSYTDVLSIIGQATLLIFPSVIYEGFGRSIIEAYAKGTPVIASRMGTMQDLVIDGVTGFHFHPGDCDDLAEKVDLIISDPQKLHRMRMNARQEYEQKYSGEAAYVRLMEILDGVRRSR